MRPPARGTGPTRWLFVGSFLALAAIAAPQSLQTPTNESDPDVLTNDTVVALVKAGLGPPIILAKIESSPSRFDVSASALVLLKTQGVPDPVIEAMIKASTAKPAGALPLFPGTHQAEPSGIAVFFVGGGVGSGGERVRIDPAPATVQMSYSFFSANWVAVIPGKQAPLQLAEPRPAFLFQMGSEETPRQFILTRLEESDEGEGRQINHESRELFDYERLEPNLFRVVAAKPLKAGEYRFYRPTGSTTPYATPPPLVFDFGVVRRGKRRR